jgi:hypothetical protein
MIPDLDKINDKVKWMDEAYDILLFAYEQLSEMNTAQFSCGADKPIRDKIKNFLDLEGQEKIL